MRVAPIALLVAIGLATDAKKVSASEPGTARAAASYEVRIAPQALGSALQELARQSGSQIIFFSRLTEGLTTRGLDGKFTLPQAMERLLADSGLTFRQLSEQAFEVRQISRADPAAAVAALPSALSPAEKMQTGIPEILVTGIRGNLNLDIERTENDVLPYVVFHRRQILQSGASTVEEFLKFRLPMNTLQQSNSQNPGSLLGARSQVNLRGFGANQTLVLIDGRRTSSVVINSTLQQADLNGIALRAVERIEVLPTSASGIYGGDATGGVINIIMRRDYQGSEVAVGYENVFDGEARLANVSLRGGFSLEDGKTNVSMGAFWSDANLLRRQDREFIRQYRDRAYANTPELWLPPALAPLGYTTNIRSTGGNLTLDDGTALNSLFTSVPVGYAGPASDGGAALVANAGKYNFEPADSGQILTTFGGKQVSLVNTPSLESIDVTVRREFGSGLQAFLDAGASNSISRASFNGLTTVFALPAGATNNPFQQNIEVHVPVPSRDFTSEHRSSDRRVVAGVISKLPWQWTGELDYVWHRSGIRRVASQFTRTGSGPALATAVQQDPNLNPLRDTNVHRLDFSSHTGDWYYGPFETTTRDVTALLGGPVGTLPGGHAILSIRLEHRDESFATGTSTRGAGSAPESLFPKAWQSVGSALAELRLPLVPEIEAQLSLRRDEYRIRGSQTVFNPVATTPTVSTAPESTLHSTNPTFGMRWTPLEDVAIRASFGSGFLPPNVTQLTERGTSSTTAYSGLLDPRRGNLPVGVVRVRIGGNPALKPEASESRSAGIIFTPRWAQGMRLAIDYTHIDRSDRIVLYPFGAQSLINEEAQFPGRIVRETPTAAEAAMGWAGPITLIDETLLNFARAETEAFDLQFDYSRDLARSGSLDLYVIGTWNRHNITQTRPGEPEIDNVGFSGGVLEYKINGGVTWTHGGLTLGWNTQYFDSYLAYPALALPLAAAEIEARARLVQTQGSAHVDSQMYHDAFATYRFERLGGSELTLGFRNVFNTRPPRDQQSYSTYGDPRLASYYLGFRMSFD